MRTSPFRMWIRSPIALLLVSGIPAQVDWTTPWIAQFRDDCAMAYDSARDRVVLFGGVWNGQVLGDTWEWNGSDWVRALPTASPPPRKHQAMTYDGARGVVVLCGGQDAAGTPMNDTWEWDGATWTQRVPVSTPPAWPDVSLTWDARRGVAVGMFSMAGASRLWEWNGADWLQRPPVFTTGGALAFDSTRQRTVCVAGTGTLGVPTDTYLWDGTMLSRVAPAPPNFGGIKLVDDPSRGRVFGLVWAGAVSPWQWDGSAWTSIASQSNPSLPFTSAFVDDAGRQHMMLMGSGVTWQWDGTSWSKALPLAAPPNGVAGQNLVYDPVRDRTVLSGYASSGTWEWNGSVWTKRQPPVEPAARFSRAMTYAASQHAVVLFGGQATFLAPLGDTWSWDGVNWSQRQSLSNPPPRYDHALAYDSVRDRVVLFGGQNGSTTLDDTWEWDGVTWVRLSPPVSPRTRRLHSLAYDAARQRTVLFGGDGDSGGSSNVLSDTWVWDGAQWMQMAPTSAPSARSSHSTIFDGARGRIVLSGGVGARPGGLSGPPRLLDTWEWDGVDWTQRTTAGAGLEVGAALAYDGARREIIGFGGAGPSGQAIWRYAPTHPADYVTSGTGCPGSAGTPTLATASASGFPWLGDPFSVRVTGLAPGHAVAIAAGFSSTAWGSTPLPLSLAFFAMPGCQLYCSAPFFFPVGVADAGGVATWNLGVLPNDPGYLGFRFFTQAWIADDVNARGLITSDFGEAIVGGK